MNVYNDINMHGNVLTAPRIGTWPVSGASQTDLSGALKYDGGVMVYYDGTGWVNLSTLQLGVNSTDAFRGDHGNTAYLHATDADRITTAQSEGLYKIAVTDQGHVKSVVAVVAADIPDLSGTYKTLQSAVPDPSSSGTAIDFIDSASQDTNGVLSVTKKAVRGATDAQTGVVELATDAEAATGTDATRAVTPHSMRAAHDDWHWFGTPAQFEDLDDGGLLVEGKIYFVEV